MSILNQKTYFINTVNKLDGRNGDFTYEINIPQTEKFDRVCVLQASIPLSFYLIQKGVNTFTLREQYLGTDSSRVITIPEGNYNYQTFQETLLNLINSNSPLGLKYACSFSKLLAKYTWTVSSPTYTMFYGTVSFIFNNHLSQQFGFDRISENTFTSSSLTSKNTVNFIPESTIYIHSDICDGDNDILQTIYSNNTVPFSQVVYQLTTSPDAYSKNLRTSASNKFRFFLTDEENNELLMNGQNVLITLLIYKKDAFTEYFKKYITWVVSRDSGEFNETNETDNN